MKNDRLYAMTVYLLNHGKTSAQALAEHFEVSVRTVRRDIDALCRAGVPVVAITGAGGGYRLDEEYRMDRQLATPREREHMVTALRALETATGDPEVANAAEKMTALHGGRHAELLLDFSVLGERDGEKLQWLRKAVRERRAVCFTYTNAAQETRVHEVEPVALMYRWYAWYLLAWSSRREDYRTYKLVRMHDLRMSENPWSRLHPPAEEILRELGRNDSQVCVDVEVRCSAEFRARAVEYLNGTVLEANADGSVRMRLRVVENEQHWIGTLLSFGDGVEILSPPSVRSRVMDAAQKIVRLYQKG